MKQLNIKSKVKKKYRATTDSTHKYPVAKNLLDRNFTANATNIAWVSDITYISTKQGWLYLTVIIDIFDRQVIGWSLSTTMFTRDTIIPAWKMATRNRPILNNCIFHSDRGVQYACKEFTDLINANKFVLQSMSRKANCWDNAVAESFFKTLKAELVYHQVYQTIKQAEMAVFEYIEIWYNRKRLHSSLGYKTPFEFEDSYLKLNQKEKVA